MTLCSLLAHLLVRLRPPIAMRFLRTYLVLTLSALMLARLPAAIVVYEFPQGAFTPTTADANVIADAINTTGGIGRVEPGTLPPDTLFYRFGATSPTPAAAVTNNEYFQFTLAPLEGYELDLTTLAFDGARGGNSEPRGFLLRTSQDGFTTDAATANISTVAPTYTSFNLDLSAPTFQNIRSSTTFRLYQYAPSFGGTGNFYENVSVSGSVNAIPEPPSALYGLALVCVAATRRCRRHKV